MPNTTGARRPDSVATCVESGAGPRARPTADLQRSGKGALCRSRVFFTVATLC